MSLLKTATGIKMFLFLNLSFSLRSSSPLLADAMASSSSQLDTSVDSTMSSDFGPDEQQRRSTPPEMVIAKFLLQVIGVATSKLHQVSNAFTQLKC
jgi:hypothetical protein